MSKMKEVGLKSFHKQLGSNIPQSHPYCSKITRVTVMSKPAAPGWMINKVPKKPVKIANKRLIPTFSPRNKAAAAVTNNGTAWITAPIVDRGTKTNAKNILLTEIRSPTFLQITAVLVRGVSRMTHF